MYGLVCLDGDGKDNVVELPFTVCCPPPLDGIFCLETYGIYLFMELYAKIKVDLSLNEIIDDENVLSYDGF